MIATMEDINRPVDSADRCQWVKHIQVGRHTDGRPDYTVSEWEWPSQFVMKEVRKALDEHAANWHASHRLTTDSLLLGKLYQDEVFQKLRCETEYVAVRLGGREIEEIKFKAESYKLFSSSSHIDLSLIHI